MDEKTTKRKRMAVTDNQGRIIKAPNITTILIDKLVPFRNHPFQTYEGERLEKLAESIRNNGLHDPVVVRCIETAIYEILSGHNRIEAVKLLGWNRIPAIVKDGLSDEAAERIVIESNLNQQSFANWKYSQQIRVIKMYSKHIRENSQQGKRNDLIDGAASAYSKQKYAGKPKPRPTSRDKYSQYLGINSAKFSKYSRVANLDEETAKILCELLDEKRMGFEAAYRLSQLKPGERATVISLLKEDPEIRLKKEAADSIYRSSRNAKNAILTEEAIRIALYADYTIVVSQSSA